MSFAKISAEWLISKPSQHLLSTLRSAGFAAFFVGGCVRNTLLGEAVSDLDVATDALPEDVTDLAQEAGVRVVPTGLAHGTVTVLVEAQRFEVTTFRKDVSTDGRHAEVQFSKSLEADARRRDFTMNALYVDREGQVIAPVGGIQDLRDRQRRI
mgnify:CR=1 FL=1